MAKFIISAALEAARVYAEVEADSMEEAMRIAKSSDIDWQDEEWVSPPTPISITGEQGHMREF